MKGIAWIALVAAAGLTAAVADARQADGSADANAAVTIDVDAAANRHPIDPRIDGVSFADASALTDLDLPLNRWGGNATSRYNWVFSTANRAKDWFFENIPPDRARRGVPSRRPPRAIIGLPALVYTDPTLAGGTTTIKGAYLVELRDGVK